MKNTGGRPRKCLVLKADDIPQKAYFTVKEAAELTGTHIHTYTHHTGKATRRNAEREKIGERMAYISGFANTSNGVIRKWL